MAKKKAKKKARAAAAGPTVTVVVPDAVWKKIKDIPSDVGADMIRAILRDDLYGVKSVQLVSENAPIDDDDDDDDDFKVCQGP